MLPIVHHGERQEQKELWHSGVASECVQGAQLHPRWLIFLSPSNSEFSRPQHLSS